MPNLVVIRPCDANETAEAWRYAIVSKNNPTALILTRQNVPVIDRTKYASPAGLVNGAYVLTEEPEPQLIIIASGSEVSIALEARERLMNENISVRVVSMPSFEIFQKQPQNYKDEVLPPSVTNRIVIEAGSSFGWERYSGSSGIIIAIDHFGASAPGPVLLREFGFTAENVCQKAKEILKR
jgi:transketolase